MSQNMITPDVKWGIVNRGLVLVGDALVAGVFLVAVNLGLLDRNAAIALVGYALRALVQPSVNIKTSSILPVSIDAPH